jgi:hypothetical protein
MARPVFLSDKANPSDAVLYKLIGSLKGEIYVVIPPILYNLYAYCTFTYSIEPPS